MDDIEAQRVVEESKQASKLLIRDHLSEHLARNPDSTFVSWIAALHPENVALDPRLEIHEGNEWLDVWQEVSNGRNRCCWSSCCCCSSRDSDGTILPQSGWGWTLGRLVDILIALIEGLVALLLMLSTLSIVVAVEVPTSYFAASEFYCRDLSRRLNTYAFMPCFVPAKLLQVFFWLCGKVLFVTQMVIIETLAVSGFFACGIIVLSLSHGKWMHAKLRRVAQVTRNAFQSCRKCCQEDGARHQAHETSGLAENTKAVTTNTRTAPVANDSSLSHPQAIYIELPNNACPLDDDFDKVIDRL
ncbi:hypothetical protein CYMTET_30557 [Cymbomonas tetramitiformis]|uniref:Uncharacterized protein n=1 Tax=Cymbomonas tetramitiformis TaxID=36881 RepID=A0AAE0FIM8_9CHLO|nr:hypothetical protein CYMTET_30557 [Cymbomonas tetramitiformis]